MASVPATAIPQSLIDKVVSDRMKAANYKPQSRGPIAQVDLQSANQKTRSQSVH